MTAPIWITPAGTLGTIEERKTTSTNIVASGLDVSYSLISGRLPPGLFLNTDGLILGTPVSVDIDTEYKFVIRASNNTGVNDRTFSFTVTGATEPVWVTAEGSLPVGRNGEYYTINKEFVDYTLQADTDFIRDGNRLKYYIADNDGSLPPGLQLSDNGRITGYTKDNLKIDIDADVRGGYDIDSYDGLPYEYVIVERDVVDPNSFFESEEISFISSESVCRVIFEQSHNLRNGDELSIFGVTGFFGGNINTDTRIPINQPYYVQVVDAFIVKLYNDKDFTQPVDSTTFGAYTSGGIGYYGSILQNAPRIINKIYQFYVTVTDGVASSRRLFKIEVADPDSLRVDNSYLSVDSDLFDTSAGYLLAPIWVSKYGDKLPRASNLGSVRAGKKQVFQLYDYDPYPLQGPSYFDWDRVAVNPDIKLISEGEVNNAFLQTRNLKGQNAVYYRDAEVTPVKGMKIRFSEYIPNTDNTLYTVTGVIPLTETSGILNIDQPLAQQIPDGKIFYVGTKSEKPIGLTLDQNSGALYGQLSYQPAYSSTYRFTVRITKIDQESGDTSIFNEIGDSETRIVGRIYKTLTVIERPASGLLGSNTLTLNTTTGITTGMIVSSSFGLPNTGPATNWNTAFVTGVTSNTVTIDQNLDAEIANEVVRFTEPVVEPPEGGNGLPLASTYESTGGKKGDIILLSKSQDVYSESLLQYMDGTALAYLYTGDDVPKWVNVGETSSIDQIFLLKVLGDVPSALRWVSTSSLGVLTPGEISEIAVKAENTNTNYAVQYEIIQGSVPPGLTFNPDGTVVGKVINTGQTYFDFGYTTATFEGTILNNVLTVSTVTSGEIVAHQNIFSDALTTTASILSGGGTTWNIGLSTTATISVSNTSTFRASTLLDFNDTPVLLTFDGNTSTIDKNYKFTVRASDAYRLSAIEQEFFITVFQDSLKEYTRIYVKPFLPTEKRISYRDFLTDPVIFDPALIYRSSDPEFGIQTQIKMLIETGIEKLTLNQYAGAMQEFFFRKKFYFGEVKSISAQDSSGKEIYDLVYVEIVDDQMSNKLSPADAVSVGNMQLALESIELTPSTIVSVNERLQPKYMSTLQKDTGTAIGFIKAVPLCYTVPGGSVKILSRIKNALDTGAFDFKDYNFDTDRIIIEAEADTGNSGWLFYPTGRQ